ncbi:MAG: DUF4340 domain-containing protein [Planctomycetaceae bacterium]|nr:DUF4340 domain-containing protein [Planctomycetaceae bacterium]
MSTELTKTGAWVVAAGILGIAAFLYLPQRIELESQAKVNEPLFPTYQPSAVWEIQIQRPPSLEFKQRTAGAKSLEQLTVKRHANRGWELLEFQSYPAERTQRLGLLSALLNDLKILEVISENANDSELAEYGLLAPETTEGTEAQKGTRLVLSTSASEAVGDLIVGKSVPANDRATPTAYVRPTAEKVIYRVALDKTVLTTAFVDWINPTLLGIPGPADVPTFGPTFRTVEKIEVSTSMQGRSDCDPYRAEFTYGEQVALVKLSTVENSQWTPVGLQRLPASVEFVQSWRRGLDVVPALLIANDVMSKSPELQAMFREEGLKSDSDLGPLGELGFTVESFTEGPRLMGETGLLSVSTKGGVRIHFALGRIIDNDRLPAVIYADLAPDAGPVAPEMGQLPEDAATWSDERKAAETQTLQREHAQRMEEWNLFNKQRDQDLANLNSRLAPWIYYLPVQYAQQAIPSFRLSETSEATPPTVPDQTPVPDPTATKSDE